MMRVTRVLAAPATAEYTSVQTVCLMVRTHVQVRLQGVFQPNTTHLRQGRGGTLTAISAYTTLHFERYGRPWPMRDPHQHKPHNTATATHRETQRHTTPVDLLAKAEPEPPPDSPDSQL